MNTQIRTLMMALVAVAPLAAQAESPARASDPATASVMVNCRYGHWPTRNEVARYLRIPQVTVGQAESATAAAPAEADASARPDAWHVQQYIRTQGRHECEQGATHVQVDFYPQGRNRAVAAVARVSP